MNELLFFSHALITLAVLLVCNRGSFVYLVSFSAICAVAMNIAVMKEMTLFGMAITGGNVLYAAIFFATDLLHEHHGARRARQAVWLGFAASAFFLVSTQCLVHYLPNSYDSSQTHFQYFFGFERYGRIMAASMISFLIAQHLDVSLYGWIRARTGERHLWLRNNLSTWISQAVDTVFFTVAGLYGNIIQSFPELVSAIVFAYVVKIAIALLDTPFIYLSRLPAFRPKA